MDGARTMCKLAAVRGWRRIVFLSTVGVLGREVAGPSTDNTPYREPFDHYTWSKIEAEKTIIEETRRLKIPSLILRPANIYGPNMSFKWPEVFALIQKGEMKLIGDGNVPFSLIHARDLARAILISLEDHVALAPGERITIASREVLTLREVLSIVARKLNAPPVRSLPKWLIFFAAAALTPLPSKLRFGRLRHLTLAQVKELSKGALFDSSRAYKLLGFESVETFETGIDEAIQQFRKGRDENLGNRC